MSGNVDNRIVEMQFNNQQFESNVKKSITSLDQLKASLNLESSVQSFEQLDSAAKTFSMDPMISAVQSVGQKFSALEIMAITALANITNSAVNAGKNFIKAMTFDQIGAGFEKYAQKTEAVQTIMNATGKSIDEVSVVLNKLNKYTDETSYSFTDMVSSIGKFTSAGVDLEVAEKAMEGIANWAATAGVGPQKAASAFYNLSQAMSSGSLKMIDWKSINLLNMGTKQFKETAIETAVALGKLEKGQDGVIKTTKGLEIDYKNFDSTLQEGWLDMDVMLSVFEKYSDTTQEFGLRAYKAAQEAKTFKDAIDAVKDAVSTNWMQTFELIFGNYDEARVLWTDVANELIEVFTGSAEARNELLREWHDTGGYEAMIEAIGNAWEGLKGILESIKQGFSQIIPPLTSKKLLEFTERIRDLSAGFRDLMKPTEVFISDFARFVDDGLLEETGESFLELSSTGKKLKSIFTGFLSVFDLIGQAFSSVWRALLPVREGLKSLGGHLLDSAASFGLFLTNLATTARNSKFFDRALDSLGTKFEGLKTKVKGFLGYFIDFENMQMHLPSWDDINAFLRDPLSGITKAFNSAKQSISGFFSSVREWFSNFTGVEIKLPDMTPISDFFKNLNLFDSVGKLFGGAYSGIKTVLGDIWSFIREGLTGGDFESLMSLFNKGLLGTILLKISGFIGKLKGLFDGDNKPKTSAIKEFFGSLKSSLEEFQSGIKIGKLLMVAAAIALLVASVNKLSEIEPSKLQQGLVALGTILAESIIGVMFYVKSLQGLDTGNASKSVGTLLALAVSTYIMAAAMKKVADLSWDEIGRGLAGMAGAMLILTGATKLTSGTDVAKVGGTMIAMGIALIVMAEAAKIFAGMEWEDLGKAGAAIGGLMAVMAIFANVTKTVDFSGVGRSMIAMGIAMAIFAADMKIISSMSWEELGRAGAGLLGTFAIIAAFAVLTKSVDFSGLGASMIAFGVAMVIMSAALKIIGSMEWTSVLTAVLALAAIFAIIGGFSALTQNLNLGGTAGAMIAFSAAILIFAAGMAVLAGLSWEGIAKGLVAVIAAFAILGVASLILGGVIVPIMLLSSALLMIGVAALAFGAGVMLIVTAFVTLAAMGAVGAAALVAALDVMLDGLISMAPKAGTAVVAIIYAILSALAGSAVAVGAALGELLLGLLNVLVAYAAPMGAAALQLVVSILDSFRAGLPALGAEAGLLFVDFINTIADSIRAATPLILAAFGNIISSIIEFIISALQALVSNIPGIGEACSEALENAKTSVNEFFTGDTDAQAEARAYLESLAQGVENGSDILDGAMSGVMDQGKAAVDDKNGDFVLAGSQTADGVIAGITSKEGALFDAGSLMGEDVLAGFTSTMGIASPSKVMAQNGIYTILGLVKNGIGNNLWQVADAGEKMAEVLYKNFEETAEYAQKRLSGELTFNPIISPELDMSGIDDNLNSVNGLVNGRAKLLASLDARTINNQDAVVEVASKILRAVQNGSNIYFDDGQFAGRLNRRLGALV